jgi:Tfp pilus assembly protein PilF
MAVNMAVRHDQENEPVARDRDKVALARAAERAGDLIKAEQLYREAIDDDDSHGFNNLAQLLIEDGRLVEGEEMFRRGVGAGDSLAAKNLALFLLEQGQEFHAKRAMATARRMGRTPTADEESEARAFRARSGKRPRVSRGKQSII